MSSPQFDAFGERVSAAPAAPAAEGARGSAWLMRTGAIVFWTMAAAIVTARALWFDPDWAARFDQAIAFARSLAAPLGV